MLKLRRRSREQSQKLAWAGQILKQTILGGLVEVTEEDKRASWIIRADCSLRAAEVKGAWWGEAKLIKRWNRIERGKDSLKN